MAYTITDADIDAAIASKYGSIGENPKGIPEPDNYIQKSLRQEAAHNPLSYNFSSGLIKGTEDIAENLINFPRDLLGVESGDRFKFPESLDPNTYKPADQGMLGDGANLAGNLASYLAPSKLGATVATKIPSLLGRILAGGAGGAAIASGEMPGGRLIGAALGAAAPALSTLSKTSIGKEAANLAAITKQEFKQRYDKIFKEATNLPGKYKRVDLSKNLNYLTGEPIPADIRVLQQQAGKRLTYLDEMRRKPSVENSHKAQVELTKLLNDITLNPKNYGDPAGLKTIVETERDSILSNMQKYFQKKGKPDLGKQYTEIREDYATKGGPFSNEDAFRLHRGKKISAHELTTALLKNKTFLKSEPGKALIALQYRNYLNQGLKVAAPLGTGAGLLHGYNEYLGGR